MTTARYWEVNVYRHGKDVKMCGEQGCLESTEVFRNYERARNYANGLKNLVFDETDLKFCDITLTSYEYDSETLKSVYDDEAVYIHDCRDWDNQGGSIDADNI